jgi:hypothetical protein
MIGLGIIILPNTSENLLKKWAGRKPRLRKPRPMKINPAAAIARLRSKSQPVLIGVLGVIILLEVSFLFFDIVSGSVTVFDLQGISVIVILVCARPKLYQSTFWSAFKRLPVLYQICLFVAMYIMVSKAMYFAGYFASVVFKGKFY